MDPNEVKRELRAFICRELLRRPDYDLSDDHPLITGGVIDSFSIAQIGVFIENAFGVYVPDNDLTVENMDTLDLMVSCIVRAEH